MHVCKRGDANVGRRVDASKGGIASRNTSRASRTHRCLLYGRKYAILPARPVQRHPKKEQLPVLAIFVQGSLWVWSATSRRGVVLPMWGTL